MFGLPVAEPCRYPSEVAHRRQPQIVASSDADHRCLLVAPWMGGRYRYGPRTQTDVSRIAREFVCAQVTGGPRDCHPRPAPPPSLRNRATASGPPALSHLFRTLEAMDVVGRVIGTEDATPLEFWVGVGDRAFLQLDDVVALQRVLPDGEIV